MFRRNRRSTCPRRIVIVYGAEGQDAHRRTPPPRKLERLLEWIEVVVIDRIGQSSNILCQIIV